MKTIDNQLVAQYIERNTVQQRYFNVSFDPHYYPFNATRYQLDIALIHGIGLMLSYEIDIIDDFIVGRTLK